jgi:hypothetical protein
MERKRAPQTEASSCRLLLALAPSPALQQEKKKRMQRRCRR